MERNSAYRQHLQDELAKRAKKNSRFSVRAFARMLNVEPSSLAQVLTGKRTLTDQMCVRLAAPLGISEAKLRLLMRNENAKSGIEKTSLARFKRLQEDAFRVIADWYYYAILEITRTKDFRGDINWIAGRLDLTTAQVHTAVERLKRLGYLQIDQNGIWKDELGSAVNLGNEKSTIALREHQKQLLKKASDALESISYEERVQSSMILVGSRNRVAEAKNKILNFIEELDEFMKEDGPHEDVYTLSVSLFPVSRSKSAKGESNETI